MTGWLEKVFEQLSPAMRHAVMFIIMGAIAGLPKRKPRPQRHQPP